MKKVSLSCVVGVLLVLMGLSLMSCQKRATKPPPPSGIRQYHFDNGAHLYMLIESVFQRQGFSFSERMPDRGFFSTAWVITKGKKYWFFQWEERRKYEILISSCLGNNKRFVLDFSLFVAERPPRGESPWVSKSVIAKEDKAYLKLLEKIDEIVQTNGGRLYGQT